MARWSMFTIASQYLGVLIDFETFVKKKNTYDLFNGSISIHLHSTQYMCSEEKWNAWGILMKLLRASKGSWLCVYKGSFTTFDWDATHIFAY